MELKKLSDEKTRELEQTTRDVQVFMKHYKKELDLPARIQMWYIAHGIAPSRGQTKQWSELSELLGHEPNYYAKYVHKNAVWGLEWRGNKFVFYKDQRGISLQLDEGFDKKAILPFLRELEIALCKTNEGNE